MSECAETSWKDHNGGLNFVLLRVQLHKCNFEANILVFKYLNAFLKVIKHKR